MEDDKTEKKKESKFGSYFTVFDFLFLDKRLTHFDIYLLSKILAIISNELPCFATNKYFSRSFNVSVGQIKKSINHLVKLGYINRTITREKGGGKLSTTRRVLTIPIDKRGGYYSNLGVATIVAIYNKVYNRLYTLVYNQSELKKIHSEKTKRKPLIFNTKNEKKKKHLPIEKASPDAVMIVKRWNKYNCGKQHKKFDTKLIKKTLYHLDHKVLPKYPLKRILKTMRDYAYMLDNPYNFRISKKKIDIYSFFVISKFMRTNKKKNGDRLVSYFDRIIKSKDLQEFSTRKDKYPNTTRRLKNFYRKHVLVEDNVDYTYKQEGQFIKGAAMLHSYMEKKRLEKFINNANINTYVRVLFQALSANWGNDLGVHNLCSKYTYSDTLPKFISEEFES